MRIPRAAKLIFVITTSVAGLSMNQGEFMDQKKIVPLLGKEGPFNPTGEYSPEEARSISPAANPGAESRIIGGLAAFVMRDSSFAAFSRGLSGGDRYLDLRLNGNEWEALFLNVLECPDVDEVTLLPNEDTTEWQMRYARKFNQAIPTYPMLGRMWDMFIYVSYNPDEIDRLRHECLKIQSTTSNEEAQAALTKLLAACDEASKLGFGLLFVPD